MNRQIYSGPHHETPPLSSTEENELDRDWYGGQEDGVALGDEFHNPFGGESEWAERQYEAARVEKKNNRRMNAKAMQRQRDTDAWEANRMLQSGGKLNNQNKGPSFHVTCYWFVVWCSRIISHSRTT